MVIVDVMYLFQIYALDHWVLSLCNMHTACLLMHDMCMHARLCVCVFWMWCVFCLMHNLHRPPSTLPYTPAFHRVRHWKSCFALQPAWIPISHTIGFSQAAWSERGGASLCVRVCAHSTYVQYIAQRKVLQHSTHRQHQGCAGWLHRDTDSHR
jgi:hypothetical protein